MLAQGTGQGQTGHIGRGQAGGPQQGLQCLGEGGLDLEQFLHVGGGQPLPVRQGQAQPRPGLPGRWGHTPGQR